MRITVTADVAPALKMLDGMGKQLKYATAVALTKTAKKAEQDVKAEMRLVFDRPVPYTLNATRVIPATKQKLEAYVWLKDRYGKAASKNTSFLWTQVFGGPRGRKAFETALQNAGVRSNEFLVPADGAPVDAYGNVPPSLIRQVLSGLKSAETRAGYNANVRRGPNQSAQSKRRQARAGTFFIPDPYKSTLPRGIYQRKRMGSGWAHRMIFKIVTGKPKYRPNLKLSEVGDRAVRKYFQQEFNDAYQRALATAR